MMVLSRNVKTALTAVACLWVIFFLGIILSQFWSVDIRSFGIQPREAEGLAGILFWPFLHGNIFHLLANSFALFFLLLLSLVFFKKLTILALVYPAHMGEPANPLVTPEHIKPEWFFFATFRWLKLTSFQVGVLGTMVFLGVLLFWPFIDRMFLKKFPGDNASEFDRTFSL